MPVRAGQLICRQCWQRSRCCRYWACRLRARRCVVLIRCFRSCRCREECRSARWPSFALGSGQRSDSGRCDSGKEARSDPCGPGSVSTGSDRCGRRVADMNSHSAARHHSGRVLCLLRHRWASSAVANWAGCSSRRRSGWATAPEFRAPPRRAPAAQVANWRVIGPPDHPPAGLRAFAERADAVTVEFENVPEPLRVRWLARTRPVRPGWQTLWVCQNRLREKRFLARHDIPHAPWRPVQNVSPTLDRAAREVGLPLVLKTAVSGYDGKERRW